MGKARSAFAHQKRPRKSKKKVKKLKTLIVALFSQIKRDGEDQARLLVDHARFSGTGTLNDGDLVRIWFFCAWDCIDIVEQESMIISQVSIPPSGLQSFENRVS